MANIFFLKTMLVFKDPHFGCDVIGLGHHFILHEKCQSTFNIIFTWNYQLLVHITHNIMHKTWSYAFMAGKKCSWQYSTTLGLWCPSKYRPFLWWIYLKPSLWSHLQAVANEMPWPTHKWIRGNNSYSMYLFRPHGISFWVMCCKYLLAALGTSLSCKNLESFSGSIAHLFKQTYARSSAAIAGSESNENTFAWRPVHDFSKSLVLT